MKKVILLFIVLVTSSLNASVINIMSRDYGVGNNLNFELGSTRNDAAVSVLLDSNNFGTGGVVEDSISLSSTVEFTAASLVGVDIIMMAGISSFSASEQAVVTNFINNGGALIGSSNRVGSEMGFLLGTSNHSGFTSGTITSVSDSNPVTNGPFGHIPNGTTTNYSTSKVFDNIGSGEVFADTTNGAFGVTFEQGLGRVILFADDEAMAAEFNSVHETYLLNSVAFAAGSGSAAVPEPASASLLGLGLGAMLLCRRKRK